MRLAGIALSFTQINQSNKNERNSSMKVIISPCRINSLALFVAFTVAFAPPSAQAGKQVPFRASFDTQFESVVAFPNITLSINGQGRALHMGRTTAATTNQVVNLCNRCGDGDLHAHCGQW